MVGKGEAAVTLYHYLLDAGYSPAIVDFATPLRHVVCAAFGLSWRDTIDRKVKEEPLNRWPFLSPRQMLQEVGTDLFRARWPEIWVEAWKREASSVLSQPLGIVICSDCRFANEAAAGRELAGCAVVRVSKHPHADGWDDPHSSEHSSHHIDADFLLDNDATLNAFQLQVLAMAASLWPPEKINQNKA